MSTLHHYHWQNMQGLYRGLHLMCPGDSLVIYGQLSTADQQAIMADDSLKTVDWHLVKTGSDPNMGKRLIDHAGWYRLITQHHNSCTWKT